MRYEADANDDANHRGQSVSDANRATEAALGFLVPALGGVDPMAAAFAAGKRAGDGSRGFQLHLWRAAAAVALFGAGLSWFMPAASPPASRQSGLAQGPSLRVSDVAEVGLTGAPPSSALPSQSVLVMRHAVGEAGLEGLAAPRLAVPRNIRNEQLF